MAFAATALSSEPRSFSIGPLKVQLFTWTAASGDTSGTITATNMSSVRFVLIDGMGKGMSAVPTYATNVVTLAFADPVATVAGTAMVFGI